MGTADEISKIQQEIKQALDRCGISVEAFGRWCYGDETDSDHGPGRSPYLESFKKQLKRSSSSPTMLARLERYREILFRHPDYDKKGTLPPRNTPYPEVDDEFRRGMARISKSIDEAMEEKILAQEEREFNDAKNYGSSDHSNK